MASKLKPTVSSRAPAWLALVGAGFAIILTVLNPLLISHVGEQLVDFASETGKYLVFATGFFFVFWIALAKPMRNRKLSRKNWPKNTQMMREALFSVCTQFTFLAVDLWIAYLVPASRHHSYAQVSEYGWPYYLAILFAVFFVHDTYFYWMHRLAHHPKLYLWIHSVHHESTDPTPYSAFHFHPFEAILEGLASAPVLIIFLTVPWHESIPVVWGLGMLIFNVIGHLGYEIYPSSWHRIPLLKWKTVGLHHYLHHQMVRGNYALYFRWWDTMCGTEFKDFEARYDKIFARGKSEAAAGNAGALSGKSGRDDRGLTGQRRLPARSPASPRVFPTYVESVPARSPARPPKSLYYMGGRAGERAGTVYYEKTLAGQRFDCAKPGDVQYPHLRIGDLDQAAALE